MDTTVRKITLRQCQKKDLKQGEASPVNPSIIFKIPPAPRLGSYPVPTVSSNTNLPALLFTQIINHYKKP